ncbi:uncharacterized protein TM35_000311840 [Trypanosoma theileri]|uniref:CULT domain-containing protein n=1 Tax=Trypanosoma theileri TaxID=67003 RepID=A0A1X0NND3_9TRYP|nr:uncharacterized protein TM35_000311840 [Trypanosoma theileri]ORC85998.1 hypothetical protein TM35_000311840 [Trypanosoma theileri]
MGNTENKSNESPESTRSSSSSQRSSFSSLSAPEDEEQIHEEEQEEVVEQEQEILLIQGNQEEENEEEEGRNPHHHHQQQQDKDKEDKVVVDDDDDNKDVIAVLLCNQCKSPLCSVDDILAHRASDAWMAQVYAYELDLFNDCGPLWCYSATNPAARRFDIIRCHPSTAMFLRGPWSREHSFFLGHEWCYSSCGICGRFLGWGFRPVQTSASSSGPRTPGSVERERMSEEEEEKEEKEEKKGEEEEEEGEEEEQREEEEEDDEEEEGVMIAPESIMFVGLILTHCVGDEKYPRNTYEMLQGYRQAAQQMSVTKA